MTGTAYRTPLKRILAEEGRKQRWLAERTGINYQRISLIVNGLHCDDATKRSIAEALGRDVAEVFPARAEAA